MQTLEPIRSPEQIMAEAYTLTGGPVPSGWEYETMVLGLYQVMQDIRQQRPCTLAITPFIFLYQTFWERKQDGLAGVALGLADRAARVDA